MKNFLQTYRNQRGDTIVEVLLVIAVLGFILGSSVLIVNRSSRSLQAVQEHGSGTRLAQGQMEYLKTYLSDHGTAGLPTDFCLADNGTGVKVPYAITDAKCKVDSGGGASSEAGSYGLVAHLAPITGGYEVTMTSQWDSLGNTTNHKDRVQFKYRIYTKSGAASPNEANPVCGAGYQLNPDPNASPRCVLIPPQIKVVVKKVPQNSNNTTPACGSGSLSRGGASVKLEDRGNLTTTTQTTASDSSTTFTGLANFATYKASIASVPAGYEACSTPETVQLTPGTLYPKVINMSMRPICTTQDGTRDYSTTTNNPEYYRQRTHSVTDYASGYLRRGPNDVADQAWSGHAGQTDWVQGGLNQPGSVLWKLKSYYAPDPGHTSNTNGTFYLAYPFKTWVSGSHDERDGTYVYRTTTTTNYREYYTLYKCPDVSDQKVVTSTSALSSSTSGEIFLYETSAIYNPIVP